MPRDVGETSPFADGARDKGISAEARGFEMMFDYGIRRFADPKTGAFQLGEK
jgi:hypothetical protein